MTQADLPSWLLAGLGQVGLAAMLVLAACSSESEEMDTSVEQLLQKARQQSEVLRFSELDGPAWDALYIVGPYTTPDQLRETFGPEAEKLSEFSMEMRDDVSLLVFVHEDGIIDAVEVPRSLADFAPLSSPDPIPRADTAFRIAGGDDARTVTPAR